MRALVVAPYFAHRPDHGGRIRSRMLIEALAGVAEVTVAAPLGSQGDAGEDEATVRAGMAALGASIEPLPVAAQSGASAGGGPARKLGHWLRRRSDVLERRWSAESAERVRALLGGGFDVLAVDASHCLPVVPLADPTPRLLSLHNVESAVLRRGGVREGLGARVSRAVEARMMAHIEAAHARASRLCVTVSELDRERLRALCPSAAVEVVPNAVDVDALRRLPEPAAGARPMLLFVGGFDYPPNLEAALELLNVHLPVLRASFPDLAVRLVGRDPHGVVTAHARAAGAEALGRVDDLEPHYREATAVYVPLRSGGGTRLKVLEAFALGRPVLATAVAVEGLAAEPGQHYFAVERPTDGVQALDGVLRGRGGEVVDAARVLVERDYGHAAAVDRLRALIGGHFSGGGG